MPSKLDFRLWMLDIRKKSKIYNLSSTIWRQRRPAFTLIELLVACHPKLSWDSKHQRSVQRRKAAFGFTLIELLVVMSIMAILAGSLLYSTNNSRDKGKDSVRKQDLKSISTALVAYRADHNKFPPTPATTILNYASDNADSWIPDLASNYISKLPHDPTNATNDTTLTGVDTDCNNKSFIYCYQLSADKKTFVLWAQLENTNDPEIYTNADAACRETPPTSSTPTLNYCLKSPQ